MRRSLVLSRLLRGLVIISGLLVGTSCYAPDVTHLLFRCNGSGPCPSGTECLYGLCAAHGVEACASGNGSWLTDDNFKALCPAIGSATACGDNYEPDATCLPEAVTVCTDPSTTKPNADCFRCCRKK